MTDQITAIPELLEVLDIAGCIVTRVVAQLVMSSLATGWQNPFT